MQIKAKITEFERKYISSVRRGCLQSVKNIILTIRDDDYIGTGEIALGTRSPYIPEELICQLHNFLDTTTLEKYSINEINQIAKKSGIPAPARAGLDMALWDLFGKKTNQPCYKIYGLSAKGIPTSITIGGNTPDIIKKQVADLLKLTNVKSVKVKLGSLEGIEKDKEIFLSAYEAAAAFNIRFRVDANAGWSFEQATHMLAWLAPYEVDFVEQPLAVEEFEAQTALFKKRPLPIFLDESCQSLNDISKISNSCDGIVIKLMKSGSLMEALQSVNIAQHYGLKVVLGCKSESSVGIAAALSISSIFDEADLDSYLYLSNDPFYEQICMSNGVLFPIAEPGFGLQVTK